MPWGRAFVIFFLPGGGALPRFSCPTPGNCQLKEKKSANARGLPGGGWAMLELTDALVLSCSIVYNIYKSTNVIDLII